jgi:UDP-N-acetylglucosamine:LPS N-acetylglucosamine transferase
MGHDVMAEACAASLRTRGWRCETLDAMQLLGEHGGRLGERVFRALLHFPAVYDGFHFAALRMGNRLARLVEAAARRELVPRLQAHLHADPPDLVVSVFPTAAAAMQVLKPGFPGVVTMVFCTDVAVHRLWVHPGTDVYLVTSEAAACYVRRFHPEAEVAVVPAPVRAGFYDPPSQEEARRAFGVPRDGPAVLLMAGAWGLGPIAEAADALAAAGVSVLAVAGRNDKLAARLREVSSRRSHVVPFGFTDQVPALMAASDLVVTTSGDTCSEARVIGRDLMLLDVVPGHGRDNLQHELERGHAGVASADAELLVRAVLAALRDIERPLPRVVGTPQAWERAFDVALARAGLGAPDGGYPARLGRTLTGR